MSLPDRCEELKELVWLAIDGELGDDEQRALDRHLAECAACRARVESSRRIAAGLQKLPAPAAPAGFKEATLARLDGGNVIRAPWRWQTMAAAAAAIVLVATWWGLRRGEVGEGSSADRSFDQVASAPKEEIGAARAPESQPAPESEIDQLKKNVEDAGDKVADDAMPEVARELSTEKRKEAQKADADEVANSKLSAGFDEKRRDQGDAAARAEANPIEAAVREADSPDAALRLVLGRIEAGRARKNQQPKADAPARPADGTSKEADGEFGDELRLKDASRKDTSTRAASAAITVDFLDVTTDDESVRAWLHARRAIAEEAGVVVVDVTPAERDELLAALERKKAPAQPKSASAWFEQVTAAAPARKPAATEGNERAEGTNGRGQPPPAAPPIIEGPGTAGARKGEEKQALPRVRVVLWLGSPKPPGQR